MMAGLVAELADVDLQRPGPQADQGAQGLPAQNLAEARAGRRLGPELGLRINGHRVHT
jgi:hypothetical protein